MFKTLHNRSGQREETVLNTYYLGSASVVHAFFPADWYFVIHILVADEGEDIIESVVLPLLIPVFTCLVLGTVCIR